MIKNKAKIIYQIDIKPSLTIKGKPHQRRDETPINMI